MRDGGILDPDDHLFEVFDEENDQILAIYDEQDDASPDPHRNFPSYFAVQGISSPPTSPIAVTSTPLESRKAGVFSSNADGDIVEITSLSEPPS
ncbi:unnamed protein product [Toxocara canis]|uniref:Par3_HAL_N_term domain-containing protein n=1 Tax=Toxocara canis TaxID=6265 RepID=A0A183UZ96_TOXCA|nr:unnamed protein product [Toxocara canis]